MLETSVLRTWFKVKWDHKYEPDNLTKMSRWSTKNVDLNICGFFLKFAAWLVLTWVVLVLMLKVECWKSSVKKCRMESGKQNLAPCWQTRVLHKIPLSFRKISRITYNKTSVFSISKENSEYRVEVDDLPPENETLTVNRPQLVSCNQTLNSESELSSVFWN